MTASSMVTYRSGIVAVARALVGAPYIWGANTLHNNGVDCSGMAQLCMASAGGEPWHSDYPGQCDMTADRLWDLCEPVAKEGDVLPGDLAFYGTAERASHVVVVVSTGGGKVTGIASASGGGSNITTVAAARSARAEVKTFSSAAYRSGLLGFRRPWLRAEEG